MKALKQNRPGNYFYLKPITCIFNFHRYNVTTRKSGTKTFTCSKCGKIKIKLSKDLMDKIKKFDKLSGV